MNNKIALKVATAMFPNASPDDIGLASRLSTGVITDYGAISWQFPAGIGSNLLGFLRGGTEGCMFVWDEQVN